MAKKKKRSFIDKKQAETYHLVRRSQRDVGGYFDSETGEPLDIPKEFVLLPDSSSPSKLSTNRTNKKDDDKDPLSKAKSTLASAGLLDEYDYSTHLRPITGTGTFVPPPSTNLRGLPPPPSAVVSAARNRNVPEDDHKADGLGVAGGEDIQELDRRLDAIALSAECMDDDIAQALFGDFEGGEYEEILDDFCLTADALPDDSLLAEDDDEKKVTSASNPDFDFEAHAKMLIERAKREDASGKRAVIPSEKGVNEWWDRQAGEFAGVAPHGRNYDGDDGSEVDSWDQEFGQHSEHDFHPDDPYDAPPPLDLPPTNKNNNNSSKLTPEEEQILADKFAQTLLEYDSDELGDLDTQYAEITGSRPIEGDLYVDSAVEEFLREKSEGVYHQTEDQRGNDAASSTAHPKRTGGSSHVLIDGKLHPPSSPTAVLANLREISEEEKLEAVLREADETLARDVDDLPPEEIRIDGKSYFDVKEQNPWDCESILSTYSNLDHNPAVIRSGRRRGKKKKKNSKKKVEEEAMGNGTGTGGNGPIQIRLSSKTGLPIEEKEVNALDDISYDENTYYDDTQTYQSVNRGLARRKNETAEEKKARKQLVKQEREIARLQKKMVREAIGEEFRRREGNLVADGVAGKSVFRF